MIVLRQLRLFQRWAAAVLALRALLAGAGIVLLVHLLATLLLGASGQAWALAAGLVGVGILARRTVWPREAWRTALWVEEQLPDLRYKLVSLVDERYRTRADLQHAIPPVPWGMLRWRASWRALRLPTVALLALLGVEALLPSLRAAGLVPGSGVIGAAVTSADRKVQRLVAVVRDPEYVGGRIRRVEEPADVAALAGSTVELLVQADTAPSLLAGDRPLHIRRSGDEYRGGLTMPAAPLVLRVSAGRDTRLLTLTPLLDSVPVLALRMPASDTTLRAAAGQIRLAATVRDDIGVVLGGFEYIVSSGSGESFTFRSGTLGVAQLQRAREAELQASLDLGVLGLAAGDVIHVRAVASDGAPLEEDSAARWRGASETRVIRIARPGEYDSVAVEGAPPPELEGALSQRMLLMLTEALDRRRARLRADSVRSEARRIAVDQSRLRKRVGALVFDRLAGGGDEGEHAHEHDERLEGRLDAEALLRAADEATTESGRELQEAEGEDSPVVAINRPLLEAYNHMWDAQRALEIGAPHRAIPPMRRAIAALQRARAAERIYLRGRPPVVVVDVPRVRLAGTDRPERLADRVPGAHPDRTRQHLAARLRDATIMSLRHPAAAADSLLLLRVDALTDAPEVAELLGRAAASLRRGTGAGADLARARRVLLGPVRSGTLREWTVILP